MPDARDPDAGGEIVWLTDPGAEARWAGPVAVDVSELEDLVAEALEAVGQVAVTGSVKRVLRRGGDVVLELGGRADGRRFRVSVPVAVGGDVGSGIRVTIVGGLAFRPGTVTLTDPELWSPTEVSNPGLAPDP